MAKTGCEFQLQNTQTACVALATGGFCNGFVCKKGGVGPNVRRVRMDALDRQQTSRLKTGSSAFLFLGSRLPQVFTRRSGSIYPR